LKAVIHVEQEVENLDDLRKLIARCNVALAIFCMRKGFKFIQYALAIVFEAMRTVETVILVNNKKFDPAEFKEIMNHFGELYIHSVEDK